MPAIDESKIEFRLEIFPEEIAIEGNASAIDAETDAETEQWIRDQLESGNDWAWCTVKVTATYPGLPFKGVDYLGGCSYTSEESFKTPGGYWQDMKDTATADLLRQIEDVRGKLCV
jgi:hypothetical protein